MSSIGQLHVEAVTDREAPSSAPLSSGAGARLLFPCESIVLIFILLAVLLYQLLSVDFRSPWTLYSARIKQSLALYCLGLFLSIFFVRLADVRKGLSEGTRYGLGYTIKRYRSAFFDRARIFHDLRLFNCISLMFVTYIHLKHLIPYIHTEFLDPALFAQEQRFFGGELLAQKLHQTLGVGIAPFLSDAYKSFYPFVAFSIVLFIVQRNRSLAQEYCCAFVLVWFLGILAVYLLPTLGPCFLQPELFEHLPHTAVTDMQEKLWRHKMFIDSHPADPRPVYLISGLPSLHLAVPLLSCFYLSRISSMLSFFCWAFVALTAVTTVYFGWHYVVDDIASMILVAVVLVLMQAMRDSN